MMKVLKILGLIAVFALWMIVAVQYGHIVESSARIDGVDPVATHTIGVFALVCFLLLTFVGVYAIVSCFFFFVRRFERRTSDR